MSMVKKILLFQASIIFSASSLHAMTQLKGTHTILAKYPGCSPFYGLVFSEKNVLRNLYEFSSFYNKILGDQVLKDAPADLDPLKKEVEDFLKEDRNTGTQTLVRQMFNMPPGGTFNPTNAPNNPVGLFKPKDFGKILRIVHDTGSDYVKMELYLKVYLQSLALKNPDGKLFSGKEFNPFVRSLVKAVQECDEKNPQALFAQGTAQGVILGYLLIKFNDRKDLKDYFEGFLGSPVILKEEKYTAQELKQFSEKAPDLQSLQSFGDFVCGVVYQQLYSSPLPKIITSNITVDFKGTMFTDCMECVIHNLCNIATYSAEDKKLGITPKELTLSPLLQKFYQNHFDVNNVTKNDSHQAWVDVVENLDGVSYGRLCDVMSKESMYLPGDCDGFIPMAVVDTKLPSRELSIGGMGVFNLGGKSFKVYEKEVGNKIFLLVPRALGLECCELIPSVRNIIVLMNSLFNLNLYNKQEEVFVSGFEQTYFQAMLTKFGWSIHTQLPDLTHSVGIDLSSGGKEGFKVCIYYKGHGSVSLIEHDKQSLPFVDFDKSSPNQKAIGVSLGLLDFDVNYKNYYYDDLQNLSKRWSIVSSLVMHKNVISKPIVENIIVSFGFVQDWNGAFPPATYEDYSKATKSMILLPNLKSSELYLLADCLGRLDSPLLTESDFRILIRYGMKSNQLYAAMELAKVAIKKDILGASDKVEIVSWISQAIKLSGREAFYLARLAIEKDILGASEKVNILSWIHEGKKSFDGYCVEFAKELEQLVQEKYPDDFKPLSMFEKAKIALGYEKFKVDIARLI